MKRFFIKLTFALLPAAIIYGFVAATLSMGGDFASIDSIIKAQSAGAKGVLYGPRGIKCNRRWRKSPKR